MIPASDPNEKFNGKILIIAPHMDDEVLACGGMIARLTDKDRVKIVYVTDGMKSPAPVVPGVDSITEDLGQIRKLESTEALNYLGLSSENLHFLDLPEAQLQKHIPSLRKILINVIKDSRPDFIFMPFRYDRHPDHLAINQVITQEFEKGSFQARLVEYFIYHRWRLLPGRNIRKYIAPDCLLKVDINGVSHEKRFALSLFKSQTTIFYPWQTRPILTEMLLDDESNTPEYFLLYDQHKQGAMVFTKARVWIKIAHRLEPVLQKWKYLIGAYLKRIFMRDGHSRK